MSAVREALALWTKERKDLYAVGNWLPADMKRTKDAIERLNKEIKDESQNHRSSENCRSGAHC